MKTAIQTTLLSAFFFVSFALASCTEKKEKVEVIEVERQEAPKEIHVEVEEKKGRSVEVSPHGVRVEGADGNVVDVHKGHVKVKVEN